ncbi:MAG: TIM barrel protein [SAR202 cluster bacterium]|nr:TIM barrel protein [SAR202 cluster bacterium]|tara:strand:+ start:4647 stop:5627 length:981 start_codon:yes stop_codon:yes gene_type:complete
MFVGTQYPIHSDTDYEVLAQLGVNHINGYPPGSPEKWDTRVLSKYRDKVEGYGINLDMVALPIGTKPEDGQSPNITLGISPQRDREIETCQNIIRACGESGIPAVKYRLFIIGITRTSPRIGRGGALRSSFQYDELDQSEPPGVWGNVSADVYWERIDYFLERIVPVAEEYNVKLACHPHDPYTPDGYRGVSRVLGTVEGMKKFVQMHESPIHGLNFCQGTISEMLDDPGNEIFQVIKWFGEREKIFNVHFRNISGGKLAFEETFPDEGDVDMLRAARVYKDVGYKGMLMPDHAPKISGENANAVAFAYCYGYIRAILQSIDALID